jgi:hypothetical protein
VEFRVFWTKGSDRTAESNAIVACRYHGIDEQLPEQTIESHCNDSYRNGDDKCSIWSHRDAGRVND